ncbi:polysaccharide deacetylase family protein [Nitratireductor thuwali]|uniref:Chitooligosaccharide deacetylase n=1 Tax=Nitratireductor thuwali TaxID=2267699 RepID=A0ABY5MER6_9HYPH|nr:Peptidoglycan-N-acetylglucosamine deacetylase [Nitratireductor thuwali]
MSVPILLYHQIAVPPPKPMPFRSMFVHPRNFAQQMAWLKRLGYQGLSLKDATPYICGEKHGKVVAITFDDGFANVIETAAPILKQCGFTATNFIVADEIGGSNTWDQPLGVVHTACMGREQLRRWMELGHEIGSHTLNHVRLDRMNANEARRQITESREKLQSVFGTSIVSFAYPYGEQSPHHRTMVREAGYAWAVTTERRSANAHDDPAGLPRKTVRRSDTALHFLKKVLTK